MLWGLLGLWGLAGCPPSQSPPSLTYGSLPSPESPTSPSSPSNLSPVPWVKLEGRDQDEEHGMHHKKNTTTTTTSPIRMHLYLTS
ncbi:hypothetical protein E2C01_048892 [Portunus trituberculatus]|uniref:Uncharacterized protein n=1 Tax=Portunus trituberculatus TaxID=210409 RepID=A0A5B7GCH4_PORTR|nr:hypothetical protein [Portunus trituberculatus]